ncbi:MAG: hypothetical protein H6Q17_556 [Bacteroidetes bacterium]|nr:hypothetical protein [Bacteroidota bacterium]
MGLVHHLSFDTDGAPVNSKQAHITVSEKILTDAGFTVRNSNNEVYLINAIVKFADFSGVEKSYTVKENFADDTLGVIFLMLGKYA